KMRVRTMERAAFLSAYRDKKLKGVFVGATGSAGNASTRIEGIATSRGTVAYGVIPEVEALFQKQINEMDRKKREDMLHQIQRLLHDRVVFAPIWENGFIRASGPRVEESGLLLIQSFPYSAPLEDVRLKRLCRCARRARRRGRRNPARPSRSRGRARFPRPDRGDAQPRARPRA